MSDDVRDPDATRWTIVLFALIAALIGWDLVTDFGEGSGIGHVAIELGVLVLALTGVARLWRHARRTERELYGAQAQARRWREESRDLLRGLGAAIERQFSVWQLTRAESNVGLLLLKGLSYREIAALRQTSERTVREQGRALFRKAGLTGRPALSAFFLEDLLLPIARDGTGADETD